MYMNKLFNVKKFRYENVKFTFIPLFESEIEDVMARNTNITSKVINIISAFFLVLILFSLIRLQSIQ